MNLDDHRLFEVFPPLLKIHESITIFCVISAAQARITGKQISGVLAIVLNPHCLNPTQSPVAA